MAQIAADGTPNSRSSALSAGSFLLTCFFTGWTRFLRGTAVVAVLCFAGMVGPLDGAAAASDGDAAGGSGLSTAIRGAVSGLKSRVGELESGVERLPDAGAEAARLAKHNAEMAEKLKQLQARFAELKEALDEGVKRGDDESVADLEETLRQLREQLEAVEREQREAESSSDAEARRLRLADEIAELRQEAERLRLKLETLKKALVAAESEVGAKPDLALEDRVRELKERLEKLRGEKKSREADLARMTQKKGKGKDAKADIGKGRMLRKKAHHIAVIGKQVMPVDEPYYEFEWKTMTLGTFKYKYVSKVTRVKDGETVERALARGGCIAELLDKCKADSDYIRLFVCPDGVPAFRRIVAEAKSRGIDFFWIPHDDTPIEGSAGGGGNSPMM